MAISHRGEDKLDLGRWNLHLEQGLLKRLVKLVTVPYHDHHANVQVFEHIFHFQWLHVWQVFRIDHFDLGDLKVKRIVALIATPVVLFEQVFLQILLSVFFVENQHVTCVNDPSLFAHGAALLNGKNDLWRINLNLEVRPTLYGRLVLIHIIYWHFVLQLFDFLNGTEPHIVSYRLLHLQELDEEVGKLLSV